MAKRPICLTFIGAIWLLAASPDIMAGPLEDGAAAFGQRDYATALRLWRPLAESGDAEAENNLARMNDAGLGVPIDHAEALRWRTQAAEHGNLAALKLLINKSMGVRADTELRHWLEIAAAKGDAESQFVLGKSFLFGQFGNPKDAARGIGLLQDAANNGDARAATLLGGTYFLGTIVPGNPDLAAVWYQKAADQGDAGALTLLGTMYGYGQGVPKDKARALALFQQIAAKGDDFRAAANKLIAQLEQSDSPPPNFDAVRARAEQGDAAAQTELGRMYRQENTPIKDYGKAFAWFQSAAALGNPDAEALLSVMYRNGQGVAKDPAQAVRWLRKAADDGQADSQHLLSRFYGRGENGFPVDPEQSLNWLKKSSASGDKTAQTELARLLWDGNPDVPRDREEATRWLQKAALQGNFEAQMTLGQHLEVAGGDQQSLQDALRWYRMAAAQEDPMHVVAKAHADELEARIAREASGPRYQAK